MTADVGHNVGRGHGKLILFGEHAVVHGIPAIVAGLPLGAVAHAEPATAPTVTLVRPDGSTILTSAPDADGEPLPQALFALFSTFPQHSFDVRVEMSVPLGVGMGSSAAMAAAIAGCLAQVNGLNADVVERAVAASERVFHGTASGIDQAAAVHGGTFRFERGTPPQITPLVLQPLELVVVQAGPPALTSTMVSGVRQRLERAAAAGESILSAIRATVESAQQALVRNDIPAIGEWMDINHGLLVALGVSTPEIERVRGIAQAHNAFGSKLTGAGGGGSVIALAHNGAALVEVFRDQGFESFRVTIV